jgi:hypothetical protein
MDKDPIKHPEIAPFRWKKGQSGNPRGRPPFLREMSDIIKHNKHFTFKLIHDYARLSVAELIEISKNPQTTAMSACVARLYSRTIAGSPQHLKILLDRLIGPVKVDIDVKSEVSSTELSKYSSSTLKELYERIKSEAEALECTNHKSSEQSAELLPQSLPLASDTES